MLLFSTLSFGKGVLSVQSTLPTSEKDERLTFGLSIYEPIISGLAYNSYTGTGENRRKEGDWYITKHQLDFHVFNITLSPGVALNYDTPEKEWDKEVFVKAQLQLW